MHKSGIVFMILVILGAGGAFYLSARTLQTKNAWQSAAQKSQDDLLAAQKKHADELAKLKALKVQVQILRDRQGEAWSGKTLTRSVVQSTETFTTGPMGNDLTTIPPADREKVKTTITITRSAPQYDVAAATPLGKLQGLGNPAKGPAPEPGDPENANVYVFQDDGARRIFVGAFRSIDIKDNSATFTAIPPVPLSNAWQMDPQTKLPGSTTRITKVFTDDAGQPMQFLHPDGQMRNYPAPRDANRHREMQILPEMFPVDSTLAWESWPQTGTFRIRATVPPEFSDTWIKLTDNLRLKREHLARTVQDAIRQRHLLADAKWHRDASVAHILGIDKLPVPALPTAPKDMLASQKQVYDTSKALAVDTREHSLWTSRRDKLKTEMEKPNGYIRAVREAREGRDAVLAKVDDLRHQIKRTRDLIAKLDQENRDLVSKLPQPAGTTSTPMPPSKISSRPGPDPGE